MSLDIKTLNDLEKWKRVLITTMHDLSPEQIEKFKQSLNDPQAAIVTSEPRRHACTTKIRNPTNNKITVIVNTNHIQIHPQDFTYINLHELSLNELIHLKTLVDLKDIIIETDLCDKTEPQDLNKFQAIMDI